MGGRVGEGVGWMGWMRCCSARNLVLFVPPAQPRSEAVFYQYGRIATFGQMVPPSTVLTAQHAERLPFCL